MQDALVAPVTGSMLAVLAATVLVICLVAKLLSSHGQRADRQREYDAAGSSKIGSNAEIPRDHQSDRDECEGAARRRDNSKVTGMSQSASHDAALEYRQDGSYDTKRRGGSAGMRKSASHHSLSDVQRTAMGSDGDGDTFRRPHGKRSSSASEGLCDMDHGTGLGTTGSRLRKSVSFCYDLEVEAGSRGASSLGGVVSALRQVRQSIHTDAPSHAELQVERAQYGRAWCTPSSSWGAVDDEPDLDRSSLRKRASATAVAAAATGRFSARSTSSSARMVLPSRSGAGVSGFPTSRAWGPVYGALDAPPPAKARTLSWLAMKERHLVIDKLGRGQMSARDAARFPFLSLAEEGCGGSPSGSPNKSKALALAAHRVRMAQVHEN